MQLKFRRSKELKGVLGKDWVFELRAMLHVTPSERQSLDRYKLLSRDVGMAAGVSYDPDDPLFVLLKKTTFESLLTGQVYTNRDYHAIIKCERTITEACLLVQNVYRVQDDFDGEERIFDLESGDAEVVARA